MSGFLKRQLVNTMLINFKQEKYVNTSSLPIVSVVCMESTLHVMTRMKMHLEKEFNHFNLISLYRGNEFCWRGETIPGLREGWIELYVKKATL